MTLYSFAWLSLQKHKHRIKNLTIASQRFLECRDKLSCVCDSGSWSTSSPSINACGTPACPRRGARQASIKSGPTCLCSFWVKDTSSLDAFYLQHLPFAALAVSRTPPERHQKAVPLKRLSPQFRSKPGTRPKFYNKWIRPHLQHVAIKKHLNASGNQDSAASDCQAQSEENRWAQQFLRFCVHQRAF